MRLVRVGLALLLALSAATAQEGKAPLQAGFQLFNDWGDGLAGEFVITNTGSDPVNGWTLAFDLPAAISNVWGGRLESHSGKKYEIRSEVWNSRIDPGGTVRMGIQAAPGGSSPAQIVCVVPQPSASPLPSARPPGRVGALPTLSSVTPSPKPSPGEKMRTAGMVKVGFTISRQWGTGFEGEVSINNESWMPLRYWTLFLGFEYPVRIASISGARLTASAGSKHRFDAPRSGGNVIIPPRATIRFSFRAVGRAMEFPSTLAFRAVELPAWRSRMNYAEALQMGLYFYEAQRSGRLPETNRVPWRGDSALKDGSDAGIDLSGGYYDAGDHVKFSFPLSASLTLLAWGGIEYGGGYIRSGQWNQLLATVRWGADWLLKAHTAPNELVAQVGDATTDHAYWGPPEKMTMARPVFKIDTARPGADLAGETAAALAASSLLFRKEDPAYSARLIEHARQLFAFAEQFPGKYSDSVPQAREFYPSSGYHDELAWAAAWLYCATREPEYLARAESLYTYKLRSTLLARTHTWDDKRYGTAILLARLTHKESYRQDAESFLDFWTEGRDGQRIPYTPGGLAWLNHWGALRYAANTAFLAFVYSDTVTDFNNMYFRFARRQIDYILGDNPAARSYMVGFGANFPRNPHHRASHGSETGDMAVPAVNRHILYGALVGGPVRPEDSAFSDDRRDLHSTEVALDYNAGLCGALARLVMAYGGSPLVQFPPREPASRPTAGGSGWSTR